MKIDLNSIDPEQFNINKVTVAGEECTFIFPPHIGTKWNKDNLIFRSSLWNSAGELISASFKKFFNWGEQPELAYTPKDLNAKGGVEMIEKIDGSTLIVSKYKGQLILRTRGSMAPENMENGDELLTLMEKYPKVFECGVDTMEDTLIFEWVSPRNRIVINYPEPDIYLIGCVSHKDYTYAPQVLLDSMARGFGVKRPRKFNFNSFESMFAAIHALDYEKTREFKSPQEMLMDTRNKEQSELTRGFEGFCVYCNHGQDIRKVKSAWYLALHKMKSELSSIDKVIDLWATLEYPDYETFAKYIEENVDFEVAQSCRGFTSRICEAKKEVDLILAAMNRFVETLKGKPRKDAAIAIQQNYGTTNRGGFCFSLLDGKPLTRDNYKKLLYQCLKN